LLVSGIVDELSQHPAYLLANYYWDYADKQTLNGSAVLGLVAGQFISNSEISQAVGDLIVTLLSECYGIQNKTPTLEEAINILITVINESHKGNNTQQAILIVNGLDELGIDQRMLVSKGVKTILRSGYLC